MSRAHGSQRIAADELLRAVAARHGAAVVAGSGDATIEGQRALLEQALDDLCANALRAGARTLRFCAQRLADQVAIHVEDDVPRQEAGPVALAGWEALAGGDVRMHTITAAVAAHGGSLRRVPLAKGTRCTLLLPAAAAASGQD